MKTKEKVIQYAGIAKRVEDMNIYKGERLTLMMDLESADNAFNLKLEELLNTDDNNFVHDILGIVENINRSKFPATDFNNFVPRFSGK